jgi:hypothetical protein
MRRIVSYGGGLASCSYQRMTTDRFACSKRFSSLPLLIFPLAGLLFAACNDDEDSLDSGHAGGAVGAGGSATAHAGTHGSTAGENSVSGGDAIRTDGGSSAVGGEDALGGQSHGSGDAGAAGVGEGGFGQYTGPSVGKAKTFAVLAYDSITTANISDVVGELGVSAAATSTITGFDAPAFKKYGIDSLAPNSQRTILAQQAVTALVGDIDPRACDADYTNVVGGLTGDITLHPGVTCMNSFSADVLVDGHVYLDAGGDPNAFFVIKGNLTLTVADAAQVVLTNGAQACGVFWRISKQVTIGKAVKFYGTVISGTAVTMKSGSTLVGRALAQTAGVQLDANAIEIPSDGAIGSANVCSHIQ